MRYKGRITDWRDDRGFGFISPSLGGDRVFVHIKSFVNRSRRPAGKDLVTYELKRDAKGRLQGVKVAYSGDQATQSATGKRGAGPLIVAAAFVALVAGAVVASRLPPYTLVLYLAASAIAFIAYAWDKWAAQTGRWRTAESTLHLFGLLGGWPGAIVAQQTLRHKSKKKSFQLVFWVTVVLNCGALLWLAVRT